jgi:hypothetical protein
VSRSSFALLPALAGALLIAQNAAALDVVVTSAADAGPGTLRAALEAVNASSDIENSIVFNLPALPEVITLASPLPWIDTPRLLIEGPGAFALTIDGDGDHPVFVAGIPVEVLTVRHLRLSNGLSHHGGCLTGIGSTPRSAVVEGVDFVGCRAENSGGALFWRGALTVRDSLFAMNEAGGVAGSLQLGGAVAMFSTAGETFVGERLLFEDNRIFMAADAGTSSAFGGGLAIQSDGLHSCTDCSFIGNRAEDLRASPGPSDARAGAIFHDGGSLVLERGVQHANRAHSAGATYSAPDQRLELINLSITENHSYNQQGGVMVSPADPAAVTLVLRNSSFRFNGAESTFGASSAHLLIPRGLTLVMSHSVFGELGATGLPNASTRACARLLSGTTTVLAARNLNVQATALCDEAGLADHVADAGFGDLQQQPLPHYPLLPSSPLVDAGDPGAASFEDYTRCWPGPDALGRERPQSAAGFGSPICDVGALERPGSGLFRDGFEAAP